MQLRVIQDSDRTCLGTIDAQVGMELANANGYKIGKVHAESVIAEHDGHREKFFTPTSIYYTEAVCWGFTSAAVDEQVENSAAIVRKFRYGEAAYGQYVEYGYAPPISDRVEEAGYDFAEQVQKQREEAIAGQLKTKPEDLEAVTRKMVNK